MKHTAILVTLVSATLFGTGCNQDKPASKQMEAVQSEAKDAAQDMKDYSYAQKAEFVEFMQGRLTALDRDMDKLSVKIESASAAFKAEAKPKLQALREQRTALNTQLAGVKDASESTWSAVKAGTQKAYDSLKDGFQQARQWVSDQVAP